MKNLRMVNSVGMTLDNAIEKFAKNLGDCTKDGYLPTANPTIVQVGGDVFITCFVVKEEV